MPDSIMAMLGSSEFLAALTGGLLAAAGSFLSLRWQHAAAEESKRRTVAVFFAEQAVHLRGVVDNISNHFDSKNEVWFEYINQIQITFDAVNRNIEAMSIISDDQTRKEIRTYFSDIYYISQRTKFWQEQFYVTLNQKNNANSEIEKDKLDSKMLQYITEAKSCIASLRSVASRCEELKAALRRVK